jgi:hypothetical protein
MTSRSVDGGHDVRGTIRAKMEVSTRVMERKEARV